MALAVGVHAGHGLVPGFLLATAVCVGRVSQVRMRTELPTNWRTANCLMDCMFATPATTRGVAIQNTCGWAHRLTTCETVKPRGGAQEKVA
jgi:hypothetical protein